MAENYTQDSMKTSSIVRFRWNSTSLSCAV